MTDLALESAEQILSVELTQDDDGDFPTAILRAKTSVITTILNTQARVDETRLRKQSLDRFPELMELLEDVKAMLPQEVGGDPT